ncbi:VRR-NUC domain-containing protein, partial [Undibacterium sp. FT31W]|nr:VRR-NUC domain-containing protein [Undibacterium griseum]
AWIERRRHKLLFHIGQYAEKQQTWSLAETAYLASGYPGARQRCIRVLEKMGASAAALELLNQAIAAPESDAEVQQLMRSAPRLNRKLGLQKPEKKAAIEIHTLHLELPYPSEDFYVEHVVREHLHQDDAPVFYVENALLNSLLGLLC